MADRQIARGVNMRNQITHRQRFVSAVSRQKADRAAFDLCGSPQTKIDYARTRDALAACLGVEDPDHSRFGIDERVLEIFDIDTRPVGGMPTPATSHIRAEGGVRYDSYGIGYREVNGHFEICHNPLRGCGVDEINAYTMPDAGDVDAALIRKWAGEAEKLHGETDYAIVAEHPVLGVFELGCWMFGFEEYLYRLAADPEAVHAFSRRVLGYQKKVIDIYYGALGRHIDCTTSGDDFGTQAGLFMSVAMFKEFVAPYLKERVAHTRRHTDAFYQHHTCGSVYELIPCLAACGVHVLNPIQPGTRKMEPERLKRDFGGIMSFWGGVDTQHLLTEGGPGDVRAEVGRLLGILGPEGYVLSPAHCIQPDVPAENIAAIYTQHQ